MINDPAADIAVPLIAEFEGFRDKPYVDQGGTFTIGFGFTVLEDGRYVTADTPPMSRDEAYARLSSMVATTAKNVRGMVYHPGITNNAIAALTSFAFNEGTNALRKSTLLMALNQGRLDEAANGFLAWIYVKGLRDHGLANRRTKERLLFLTPDNDDPVTETPQQELTADELNQKVLDGDISEVIPT